MRDTVEAQSLSLCQCTANDFIKQLSHEKTMPRLLDIWVCAEPQRLFEYRSRMILLDLFICKHKLGIACSVVSGLYIMVIHFTKYYFCTIVNLLSLYMKEKKRKHGNLLILWHCWLYLYILAFVWWHLCSVSWMRVWHLFDRPSLTLIYQWTSTVHFHLIMFFSCGIIFLIPHVSFSLYRIKTSNQSM